MFCDFSVFSVQRQYEYELDVWIRTASLVSKVIVRLAVTICGLDWCVVGIC